MTNRLQYSAAGAIQALKLGNGLWEHSNFNSRLQLTQIGLGTSSTNSSVLQLDYNYGTTANNGNLLTQTITLPGLTLTQSYTYDEVNRLESAQELNGGTPVWKQTFRYTNFNPVSIPTVNGGLSLDHQIRLTFLNSIGMVMKSHRFVSAWFAVMLLVLTLGCSTNTATTFQNSSLTKPIDEKAARTLDCHNQNEYRFIVVENPNRKKDSDPVIPTDLNIVVGNDVISRIELPKESEVKNFWLSPAEKTEAGFNLKVEWGGGLYHYKIQFSFSCKENKFYLYEVKKAAFSTTNPDSGHFWDKEESEVTKIEPNLPIEKFVMTEYL